MTCSENCGGIAKFLKMRRGHIGSPVARASDFANLSCEALAKLETSPDESDPGFVSLREFPERH
ncbi:MAG: hypothetical protein HZA50_19035 [Planctomycetes bacterium]|nr:hypothetical protein [Planctomycetota bacterium]